MLLLYGCVTDRTLLPNDFPPKERNDDGVGPTKRQSSTSIRGGEYLPSYGSHDISRTTKWKLKYVHRSVYLVWEDPILKLKKRR